MEEAPPAEPVVEAAPPEPEPEPEPAPAAASSAEVASDPAPVEEGVDEQDDAPGFMERLQAVVLDQVKSVLTVMSLPLNLVPDRLRPAVDWLAISLIFWVPIVWVLVLFVF